MPYSSTNDLPKGVKNNLPQHAQEIYRAAYNNAWKQYKDPEKRRDRADREEVSHRVAWSAVEKKYEKDPSSGQWKEKRS